MIAAEFVELPAFERHRERYLNELEYLSLQAELLSNPEAGKVVEGTGGLRKMRVADDRRGKGKRGGLRVLYYWWSSGLQFWLFAIYSKNEMADLSPRERIALKAMMKLELAARRTR